MRIYDVPVIENGQFTSESEPVLHESPDLCSTGYLIHDASLAHRGLVCMCLIDGIEDCHVACWLLAMTYGTILIKLSDRELRSYFSVTGRTDRPG